MQKSVFLVMIVFIRLNFLIYDDIFTEVINFAFLKM